MVGRSSWHLIVPLWKPFDIKKVVPLFVVVPGSRSVVAAAGGGGGSAALAPAPSPPCFIGCRHLRPPPLLLWRSYSSAVCLRRPSSLVAVVVCCSHHRPTCSLVGRRRPLPLCRRPRPRSPSPPRWRPLPTPIPPLAGPARLANQADKAHNSLAGVRQPHPLGRCADTESIRTVLHSCTLQPPIVSGLLPQLCSGT